MATINLLCPDDFHCRRPAVKRCRFATDLIMLALVPAALCVLGACAKTTTPPVSYPASRSAAIRTDRAGGSVSGSDRAAVRRFGITSPCVLHAGDSQAARHERTTSSGRVDRVVTTGTCSFNAECIRQQGKDFAGDGDVEVDCRDRSCSCRLRRWFPADASLSFSFAIDDVCSSTDMAERLLRDHCMAGLKVETRQE
jgi:hypothetical protein